jgi:hypothetical protein
MLVLSMTSANLPGSIFSGSNLKFLKIPWISKDGWTPLWHQNSTYIDTLGGEYHKLNSFLTQIGLTHYVPCSHAHQQNGPAGRKHRHIVEVVLALLAHASMPLKFWDEAVAMAAYLINWTPSKILGFSTPLERLFK